jgi:hypothetical protein
VGDAPGGSPTTVVAGAGVKVRPGGFGRCVVIVVTTVCVESDVAGDPLVQAASRASIGKTASQRFTAGQPTAWAESRGGTAYGLA